MAATSVIASSTVAALAYANAKFGISNDLWAVSKAIGARIWLKRLEAADRINIFYIFEKWAKDPKAAHKTFLLIPNDAAKADRKTEWTYAEAYDLILRYAAWLENTHGAQKHEYIAMDFTNTPAFIWMWFGLWSLGAIPVFINHNLRDRAFVHSVRVSTTRILFIDPDVREVLNESTLAGLGPDEKGRAVETVVIEPEIEQQILAQTPYRAPDEDRGGVTQLDTCLLIYTSGTTGLPKAAKVSYSKALTSCKFMPILLGLKPTDRYFTCLPLYHSSGSILGILQVLGPGCTSVMAPKFSQRNYMRWVSETKADGIHYIGEMCRYLVNSPPTPYDRAHKLRFAYGNGMRPDVWQKLKDRFNIPTIIEFYGATEGVGITFTHSRNNYTRNAIGRQGLLVRNLMQTWVLVKYDHETDMPFRDPKTGFCVKCDTNEPGEVLNPIDAAHIEEKFSGYFGNETASMSKVMRDVFKKGDAYYRSGDLLQRDAEGRMFFSDRIGDTFRWKSENVSTAEVSEVIGEHPSINEANVYGVQLPNHDGRAGCAAIVVAGEQQLSDSLAKDILNHARKGLPKYAVPLFLRLRKDVEVTGTLKHQKVGLRNEGVDPTKIGGDEIFWLDVGDDSYRKFTEKDWQRICDGSAKL